MTFQARTLFVAAATLFAGSAAYSGTFVARFYNVQPVANTNCDDHAFAMGQQFQATVAGTTVSDARCVPDEIGGEIPFWNISITYDATAAIPMLNSYDVASIYHAGYNTREACESARTAETARFNKVTGLTALTSFCRVPLFKSDQWYVSVIGFGNATLKPFETGIALWGNAIGHTAQSFSDMVRQGFARQNLELAYATLKSDIGHSTLAISYYAKERLRIDSSRIAIFANKDACLAAVADASKALGEAGVANFGTYCSYAFSQVQLTTLRDDKSRITLSHSDKLYTTYAACLQEKAATVDHYRNDLKRDVKASFCSTAQDDARYHVVMIEKR